MAYYKTRNTGTAEHRRNSGTPRNSGGTNGAPWNTNGTPVEHLGTTKPSTKKNSCI